MSVISTPAVIALLSASTVILVGRMVIRFLSRAGCVAPKRFEDCPPLFKYQEEKHGIPTMGGVLVLGVGILFAVINGGLEDLAGWILLGGVLAFALLGLVDDLCKRKRNDSVGIKGWPKFIISLAIGGILGAFMLLLSHGSVLYLPWSGESIDLGLGWVILSMIVVSSSAHAVNLTDGMDGLAVGCVAISLIFFLLWSVSAQSHENVVVPWIAALAGSCLGFLWFNSYPASVFLGDVGALSLGAFIGIIGLLTHSTLLIIVVCAVFVVEALSVILQVASFRYFQGRRIFRVAPLHHHFHLSGISEPKLIVRFWTIGLILVLIGITAIGAKR